MTTPMTTPPADDGLYLLATIDFPRIKTHVGVDSNGDFIVIPTRSAAAPAWSRSSTWSTSSHGIACPGGAAGSAPEVGAAMTRDAGPAVNTGARDLVSVAGVLAEVRELRRELRELRHEQTAIATLLVTQRIRAARISAADGDLVEAMWDLMGQTSFASREVIATGDVDLPTRAALRAALRLSLGPRPTAQRLGKLLDRIADVPVRGLVITSPGGDRLGAIWSMRRWEG